MAENKTTRSSRKKKKKSTGQKIIRILLICVIVAALVFVAVAGYLVYKTLGGGKEQKEADLSIFDRTPAEFSDDVAYYVVAVTGAEEKAPFDALALLCHDKKAKTLNVLQIPVATYVGESYAVPTVGDVWNTPGEISWCDTCRKSVESASTGICPDCGTSLTTRKRSSAGELMRFFNEQLSMPVDEYFILSHDSLAELVGDLDNLEVTLEGKMKVGETEYAAGVQTLDGVAVNAYLSTFNYKGTPASDAERLVRVRKVFAALAKKLKNTDEKTMKNWLYGTDTYKIFGLQTGNYPIRTSQGNADLAITSLMELHSVFRGVELEKMTFSIAPGEPAKQGKNEYYSLHRSELAALLQERFNPYDQPIEENDLALTELSAAKKGDPQTVPFTDCLPKAAE